MVKRSIHIKTIKNKTTPDTANHIPSYTYSPPLAHTWVSVFKFIKVFICSYFLSFYQQREQTLKLHHEFNTHFLFILSSSFMLFSLLIFKIFFFTFTYKFSFFCSFFYICISFFGCVCAILTLHWLWTLNNVLKTLFSLIRTLRLWNVYILG